MNAIYTNAYTNALHAIFLLSYFLLALYYRVKGDARFNLLIIILFFTLFVLKVLGFFAHYLAFSSAQDVWTAISLGVVFLNYVFVYSFSCPLVFRLCVVFISLVCSGAKIMLHGHPAGYLFIIVETLFCSVGLSFYTKGYARYGLIGVTISNILWTLMLFFGLWWFQGKFPVEYRYHNDIYHLMLMASMLMLFLAVRRGEWQNGSS